MSSSLNLYVSSNGTDHGPLGLEEASEKIRTGEFKPDDLAWHQGVSGWMPLKQLPEWTQINKAPLPALSPSIDQEKKTGAVKEKKEATPQPNSNTRKKINLNKGPKENSNHSFADPETANNGMGILGKILVTGAVLIFLSAIGVVGFLIYKNLDKFIPQKVEVPVSSPPPETQQVENNQTPEPDPFAPPG